jgi:hypothetical protein
MSESWWLSGGVLVPLAVSKGGTSFALLGCVSHLLDPSGMRRIYPRTDQTMGGPPRLAGPARRSAAMITKLTTPCLFLALAFAAPAAAGEIRGVINKVDLDKKELLLEGRGPRARGQSLTLALGPDTQIQVGSKAGTLADLATGKRAHVFYETRDGRMIATRIRVPGTLVVTAPPAAPAKTDAAPLTGVLRRVALTDREIVVVGPAAAGQPASEVTLAVPADAVISRDGKAIAFDDLKEGEQVAVQDEVRDGRRVAKVIRIGAAPAVEESKRERVREILKMIDWFLQMRDKKF